MVVGGGTGKRTGDLLNSEFYLALLGLAISAIFIYGMNQALHAFATNSPSISAGSVGSIDDQRPQATEANLPSGESNISSAVDPQGQPPQDISNTTRTEASVTIDGQSISAGTNSSTENETINKTIETANGSASISVQEHSSSSGDSRTSSSNRVQVNSNTTGNSNTSVQVNQHSSGGNLP